MPQKSTEQNSTNLIVQSNSTNNSESHYKRRHPVKQTVLIGIDFLFVCLPCLIFAIAILKRKQTVLVFTYNLQQTNIARNCTNRPLFVVPGNHLVLKVQNKTVPIFVRKLRKFFAKKFFFFLANLDSASNSTSPHPPSTWEFWILANLNSASNSVRPPPPQPSTWEFWSLANLNSASNSSFDFALFLREEFFLLSVSRMTFSPCLF